MDTAPEHSIAKTGAHRWTGIPTLAVMGEFSSGKSSLINFLLNEDLLPTQTTATQVPTVTLRHGTKVSAAAYTHDGAMEEIGQGNPFLLDYSTYSSVRAYRPAAVLQHMALIDTPGISDPLLGPGALDGYGDLSDMVLWCTHATQAWRESESAFWRSLPERLRKTSVLVVTRADLLNEANINRVRDRLEQETKGLFKKIIFLSTLEATAALRDTDQSASEETWQQSGGAALLETLGVTREDLLRVPEISKEADFLESEEKSLTGLPEGIFTSNNNWPSQSQKSALISHYSKSYSEIDDEIRNTPQATIYLADIIIADLVEEAGKHGLDIDSMKRLRLLANAVAKTVSVPQTASAQDATGTTLSPEEGHMATDISGLKDIKGFIGGCLVDTDTGLMLGSEGGGSNFDLDTAAAGNTEVVKSKLQVMDALGLDDNIEDVLITLGTQFHLIRPLEKTPTVFIYVALDKKTANLGLARIQVKKVEASVSI